MMDRDIKKLIDELEENHRESIWLAIGLGFCGGFAFSALAAIILAIIY